MLKQFNKITHKTKQNFLFMKKILLSFLQTLKFKILNKWR